MAGIHFLGVCTSPNSTVLGENSRQLCIDVLRYIGKPKQLLLVLAALRVYRNSIQGLPWKVF